MSVKTIPTTRYTTKVIFHVKHGIYNDTFSILSKDSWATITAVSGPLSALVPAILAVVGTGFTLQRAIGLDVNGVQIGEIDYTTSNTGAVSYSGAYVESNSGLFTFAGRGVPTVSTDLQGKFFFRIPSALFVAVVGTRQLTNANLTGVTALAHLLNGDFSTWCNKYGQPVTIPAYMWEKMDNYLFKKRGV